MKKLFLITVTCAFCAVNANAVTMADGDSFGTYEHPINIGSSSAKAHLTTVKSEASLDPQGDPLDDPLKG